MKNTYHIIPVRLATIESDEPISDVPCGSCTRCCELLAPYLTPQEVSSGKYPLSLTQPSASQLQESPGIGPIVTIYRTTTGGCGMLIDNRCSIYEDRPLACRQFDCRKGHYPGLLEFAESYFKS